MHVIHLLISIEHGTGVSVCFLGTDAIHNGIDICLNVSLWSRYQGIT